MGNPVSSKQVFFRQVIAAKNMSVNTLMPLAAGLAGVWVSSKLIPVMYHWEAIPGIASPAWHAKAKLINYPHYSEGIVYSAYDTGEPITELPKESENQMILRQKGGGWKHRADVE